jgi:hypothetical protein
MAASTITETNASHVRKRLRAREDTIELPKTDLSQGNPNDERGIDAVQQSGHFIIQENRNQLLNLYAPSAEAKIWGVAAKGLRQPSPPTLFPEYTKPGGVNYIYRELDFWTSGFFPGSLHLLLERRRKYGHIFNFSNDALRSVPHLLNLESASRKSKGTYADSLGTDTHADIGLKTSTKTHC